MSAKATISKAEMKLDQTKFGYTREELAKLLNVSTRTIDTWTGLQGGPPFIQFQRSKLYPRAQLEKWIERNLQ